MKRKNNSYVRVVFHTVPASNEQKLSSDWHDNDKKFSTAFYGGIFGGILRAVTSLRVHLKTQRHYQDITDPIEELTE